MTNEELIAQVRKELMKEIALIDYWLEGTDEVWTSQDAKDRATWTRRTLTTHLAEMEEHDAQQEILFPSGDKWTVCKKCNLVEYPCNPLLTKAKRLLGVE